MKRQVHLHEFNVLMDRSVYLPLASGLLQAYARTIPAIEESYEFVPLRFVRREEARGPSGEPSVAGFSVSMWNMNLSLATARELKKEHPECLVVFGGPHVPYEAERFFRSFPFVDVTVRGEGERAFADVLLRSLESRDFGGIPGISWRDPRTAACVRNPREPGFLKELDVFPSPYLAGVYDGCFSEGLGLQAIIETNRGCPYNCSYCFWGKGGLSKRYGFFSLERIRQIARWCGRRRIPYVFCADSNFGAFPRDLEIARFFVEAKREYGFPEKFRVCYAKNSGDTVFEIGSLLHQHGMEKSITMARQTNCEEAARNVNRKNIRMGVFSSLQRKYNEAGIPVYSELILGLPGETYESFREGLEALLRSGLKNQIFVYFCQVYPNTELDDPAYRKKFRISTVQLTLHETHAAVRSQGAIQESEEIVVSTSTMSVADWERMTVLAWLVQLFHSLKLGFFVMLYLHDRHGLSCTAFLEYFLRGGRSGRTVLQYELDWAVGLAAAMARGEPRAQLLPDFGGIYWDPEEVLYLKLLCVKDAFYRELQGLLRGFLEENGAAYDPEELDEVVRYQRAMVPHFFPEEQRHEFKYSVPEYFATYFSGRRAPIRRRPQTLAIRGFKDYKGDKRAFATEVVVYGRKSDRMLKQADWSDGPEAPPS